jgi:16S rRNA (cytosine967-C5)-methyltransferase
MVMAEKPREIAVRLLRQHAEEGGFIEQILEKLLASTNLAQVDKGLVQELVYGVVRWQETLDWLIAQKTKGRSQKVPLQILLRLGLYQMFWLERIPDHAAVHETVELAKRHGFGPQAGFINAVLRTYLRERPQTEQKLRELKISEPATGNSHPEWLYLRWKTHFGEENARKLLEWNNTPPTTFARLNTLRGTAEQLAEMWEKEGVRFFPRQFEWVKGDLVFELKAHPALNTLPSFQQGWFYVQDPSTLLAPALLAPMPGEKVLDACAAPGGKTSFMAQLMENKGLITAQDTHIARREMIRRNCERLGIHCVEISTTPNLESKPEYDRVLIDAPCSNTGVMRRRVDLRWRVEPSEIKRLRQNQKDLLNSGTKQVRSGGTLVYSTCSLEQEENAELIQEFLSEHRNFRLDVEKTLLPFTHGVDGAYAAILLKQ